MSRMVAGIIGLVAGIFVAFTYPAQAETVHNVLTPLLLQVKQILVEFLRSALQ